jgi:hypothetical protein
MAKGSVVGIGGNNTAIIELYTGNQKSAIDE